MLEIVGGRVPAASSTLPSLPTVLPPAPQTAAQSPQVTATERSAGTRGSRACRNAGRSPPSLRGRGCPSRQHPRRPVCPGLGKETRSSSAPKGGTLWHRVADVTPEGSVSAWAGDRPARSSAFPHWTPAPQPGGAPPVSSVRGSWRPPSARRPALSPTSPQLSQRSDVFSAVEAPLPTGIKRDGSGSGSSEPVTWVKLTRRPGGRWHSLCGPTVSAGSLRPDASVRGVPRVVEEVRCRLSPGPPEVLREGPCPRDGWRRGPGQGLLLHPGPCVGGRYCR